MSTLFDHYNHTELYQMCQRAEIAALPTDSRETLIKFLEGELEPPPRPHELDLWRYGIMGFLLDHWRKVETQLTCPAKSGDPRACFGCVDAQVVSCLISNNANISLIRLYRKEPDRK